MKRGREDGHLSKEQYDHQDREFQSSFSSFQDNRATPGTLEARRKVTAIRPDKKEAFVKHLYTLNQTFAKWIKEQISADPYAELNDGFQDYLEYSGQLEDRYLRKYGEVLTWGSGDCGQLAHGTEEDNDMIVKYPRIVYSLRDKKVVGIACGGLHNAIYTEQGQVYTWGCADDGSLGRDGDENMPGLVESLKNETIIRIACGDGQTIAVSTKGETWGWGSYKDKEGKKWFNPSPDASNPVKDIKKQQNTPIKIVGLPETIIDIVCGASFSIARCSNGDVYSWGIGESGELARYTPELKEKEEDPNTGEKPYNMKAILKYHITPNRMYFESVPTITNGNVIYGNEENSGRIAVTGAKAIGAGAYHAFVVVSPGDRVYATGLNNYGQLGLNDNAKVTHRDYLVEATQLSGQRIIALAGGMHHSLALSSTGQLYAFGRGDSGQLGIVHNSLKKPGDFLSYPVLPTLPLETKIINMECGGNHNLALTNKGDVYTWGYGDMSALGHGKDEDEVIPKKINFQKAKVGNITVTQVAGGGQHSVIIGKVVTI